MIVGIVLFALTLQYNLFSANAPREYIVNRYTIADGLPLNAVLQIVQAEDGFLYMATFDGLVRYDGYAFRIFNRVNAEGLSTNRISSIGIAPDGLIWLASPYGSLSSFDGARFTNHDETSLGELRLFSSFDALPAEVANLGSSKGAAIPFLREHPLLKSENVIRIDSTYVRINDQLVIDNEELRGGFEDDEGTIWVYTRNNGLLQIKESLVRNVNEVGGVTFRNTYSIFEPRPNELWIKGFMNFILRYTADDDVMINFNLLNGEPRNFQYLFADAVQDAVFGYSEAVGLRRFTDGNWPEESWFSTLFGPERPAIHATFRNQNGLLFVGTTDGLIVEEHGTSFWIKDITGHDFRWIRTIQESGDGLLWMGTNGFGLYSLNPADWSWRHYTVADGLPSNFIRDIHLTSADTLWLASQDRGLGRIIIDTSGAIAESAQILPADGLLNHGLHRIIPDQWGHLWVNSNKGIMRFTEDNLNAYANGLESRLSILKITENQGLMNNEGNGGVDNAGLMLHNGLIAFPNQAGIVLLNPGDFINIRTSGLNMPVIDTITFNNSSKQVRLYDSLTLPLGERDFRVSFTLPNFLNPELLSFSYQLEGLHNGWRVPVSGRTAVFTNVPAGAYMFHVRASGPDGTSASTFIPIIIPPYFYETHWFYGIIALLFTGVIGLLHRYRTRQLHFKEMRARSMLELQTCYVIRTDLNGNYTYANPKFLNTFGYIYSEQEIQSASYLGQNCMSSIHPADQLKVRDTIVELLANPGNVIQVDMRKPLKDGTIAYTLWDFSVIFKRNGKPHEIQCVGIDYTHRKEQERLLRESEHKLQRIIESVPHPMLIVDETLTIQSVNNEFENIFGYHEAEMVGQPALMLLPEQSDTGQMSTIWEYMQAGDTPQRMPGFQKALTKSGAELYILLSLNHFITAARKLTILILQDVTELKKRQDVILKQNQTLRDIAWHQSHIVRRPVANILGVIDLLQYYPEDTLHQQEELLEMLKATTRELDEIVKELVRKSNESEFLDANQA